MKSGSPARIKKDLESLLVSLGQETNMSLVAIVAAWEKIAGPVVASRTFPSHLKGGILTVGVLSSVWLSQLGFFRDEIARKVNHQLGREVVRSVRLCLMRKPEWWPRGRSGVLSEAELTARDRGLIEEACSSIADPELRETVRRVLHRQASLRAKNPPRTAPA